MRMASQSDPDLPSLRLPSPERRETVVQTLSSHFAAGRIEVEELEQRLDVAMRAQTLQELDAALDGLAPAALSPHALAEQPVIAGDRASRWTVAVMSGVKKKGRWFLAPLHRAVAVMGGGTLDLREAQFTADITEIRVRAVMGGFEVIVPPDLPVQVQGFGFMGGIVDKTSPAERPRVLIRAFALMGGIEVKVRERKGDAPPAALEPGAPKSKRLR
jgi:hypothetical protein